MAALFARLLLRFPLIGKVPWRLVGLVVVALVLWRAVDDYGDRRESGGRASERTKQRVEEARATAEHNGKILKVNDEYTQQVLDLRLALNSALSRPAARIIRVPVAAVCPPASAGNASVPEAAAAAAGFAEVDDRSYGAFRDWLYRFAGASDDGSGRAAAVPDSR